MDSEFSAQTGGVSDSVDDSAISQSVDDTDVEGANDIDEGMSSSEGADRTTAAGDTSGDSAPRMVPHTDLDNLRSSYDRQINELRQQSEQYLTAFQQLEQAFLQQRWDGLPEDERLAEQHQYQQLQQERAYKQNLQRLQQERSMLQQQAAPIYAHRIAEKYGVKPEDLLEADEQGNLYFDSPRAMEAAAKKLSLHTSRAKLQDRKAQGTDRMDGQGGSGAPAWSNLHGEDLIEWHYRNAPAKARKR